MADAHALLDAATPGEARELLFRCSGSHGWVEGMLARRPFGSDSALASAADAVWDALGPDHYLEAFSHHPAIGGDLAALEAKFAPTVAWSNSEQSGVAGADRATLLALADGNRVYRERFGFTFIVCATGRSAREMLSALEARLSNERGAEILIAAREQAQITLLRLRKLGAETT